MGKYGVKVAIFPIKITCSYKLTIEKSAVYYRWQQKNMADGRFSIAKKVFKVLLDFEQRDT